MNTQYMVITYDEDEHYPGLFFCGGGDELAKVLHQISGIPNSVYRFYENSHPQLVVGKELKESIINENKENS